MMRRIFRAVVAGIAMSASIAWGPAAHAHFPWLVPTASERTPQVKIYFGESADPDDPDLLDRIAAAEVWAIGGHRTEPKRLELRKGDDALIADVPAEYQSSPVVLKHTYGVTTRGGEPFLLKYYGKTYPSVLPGSWRPVQDDERLPLEIVPEPAGSELVFRVLRQGKPAKDATVTVLGPDYDETEGQTNENGKFRCRVSGIGRCAVRARIVEPTAGELDGNEYKSVRHYSTLTFEYVPPGLQTAEHDWPALDRGITSFGGAIDGDWLYVYGGHYGEAHHYSRAGQSGDFRRLNLRDPQQWESLPGGPKLTGVALVAHKGRLYRIGGFTAKNSETEEQSLWSQSDFARFDPETRDWKSLPPLPEGRSSHDAAVVGDTLYVAGGWNMQGDAENVWHETAWAVDLSADTLEWKPIASPPFRRRALALAAWQDKLYVLGGMQEQGGPTTRVAVYDPQSNAWSEGPALLGSGMEGFGSAAFACDGRLFATTMSGAVQRLTPDGKKWEFVGQLEHPRFFHRVLPWQDRELVIVGGAHMAVGKIDALERLPVSSPQTASK